MVLFGVIIFNFMRKFVLSALGLLALLVGLGVWWFGATPDRTNHFRYAASLLGPSLSRAHPGSPTKSGNGRSL